jgi:L-ribulose-5-phosphate 4-epimerase
MLEHLKIKVCEAYNAMNNDGKEDEGFVSAFDGGEQLIVVPPAFESVKLSYEDMLVIDLDGNIIEGGGEVPTEAIAHARIYENFPQVRSIAQAYFTYSTAFAQAGRDIPFYGAYHGARYYGDIPCIFIDEAFSEENEVDKYEFMRRVGDCVVEQMQGFNFVEMPALLVSSVGMLAFGKTPSEALRVAYTTEKVAKTAYVSEKLQPQLENAHPQLLDFVFNGKCEE